MFVRVFMPCVGKADLKDRSLIHQCTPNVQGIHHFKNSESEHVKGSSMEADNGSRLRRLDIQSSYVKMELTLKYGYEW